MVLYKSISAMGDRRREGKPVIDSTVSLIFIPSLAARENTLPTLRSSAQYYQIRHRLSSKVLHTLCLCSRIIFIASRDV